MDNQFFQRWEIDGVANANHKLLLLWNSCSVVSYHVTDEAYRSDCWGLDFQKNGRFYATKTSKYIDEIKDKSPLFPDEVIHFTIIGTNTIVDLLAKSYPEIRNE